jgi:catechol 2,3-dioxygenase-like lactoylglutathione lyase family enzyme
MANSQPRFDQVNLVVRDMDAALAFYRRLGVAIHDGGEWPPGSGARHVEADSPGGARFELDNRPMAAIWHAGWRSGSEGSRTVFGFSLPSRQAVDELFGDLTAAGHPGRQPPHDAFWGARYAIVQDPDGNDVGLMSPIEPKRRFVPQPR